MTQATSSQEHTHDVIKGLVSLISTSEGIALVGYSDEGTITYFDEGGQKIFGYQPDALMNRKSWRALHDAEEFQSLFSTTIESGKPANGELCARSVTGEVFPVRVTVTSIEKLCERNIRYLALYNDLRALHEAAVDMEELRESARKNLRQSEKEAEFLKAVLVHTVDTVQIAIVATELNSGMIAWVNEEFEKLTGFRRNDVLNGYTFKDLLKDFPESCERITNYLDRIAQCTCNRTATPERVHWEMEFLNGKRQVEIYGRPIVVEGHENQYRLMIIEDHTDRHKLQTQLVQSEKLAAIGQLAAGIAHEIRNPLNTIYNALFDLSEIIEDPTDEQQEDITISMEEIRRVQEIINNLLDFARESERSIGRTNINDVVRKTIRLIRHDLRNKQIESKLDLSNIPDVSLSNNALKQILINLLTNASQAMGDGGTLCIRTEVRRGRIPIRANTTPAKDTNEFRIDQPISLLSPVEYESHVVLEVSDTGEGIPPEIMPNIFNPFFTTKEPGSGTGLGLSVVHAQVRDAGGAIGVESHQGVGSTFTIELPALEDEDED